MKRKVFPGIDSLRLGDVKILEEPQGQTYQCPRCGAPLLLVAEHAFMELWECPRCGYNKRVKQ